MGTLLSPLQLDATSGVGETLIVPEPERIVRFLIRSKGPPTGGEITIESCPMTALNTILVPSNATTEWFAGAVSGTFHARISQNVTGGWVTVLAVRPEEQRGPIRRTS